MNQKQKYDVILGVLVVIGLAVFVGLIFYLFSSRRLSSEPAPIPPLQQDSSWQTVQATGILRVGTSADYPPYAYYKDDYQLDGFDVAMMREIGQRLGVQVEFSDIVFDTLDESLALGQIDTAVSAISITEERSQYFDFTNVYFVSEGVFLAPVGTTYTIETPQDVAVRRVGVQRTTVFEAYVRKELVATGMMPESNLFVYERATDAVRDLNEGRLDLVMLDASPAETAVTNNQGRIAGRGLNPQRLAMAVPKGADSLRVQLNDALQGMFNDGRIHALAQQYLGIPPEQILPTPTAPSQATVIPTATAKPCVDGMQFVDDVNLDDQNMTNPPQIPPGTSFQKIWRIRNTGTCTWDSRYYLDYVGSSTAARMGGLATAINGSVPPNGVYDIAVNLTSPIVPGTYQGFWAMHNPGKQQFGERIWVGIRVPGPPTSTPPPTQTPNPSINFVVDKTNIFAGECVSFSWNVRGAQAVYFYKSGENWQNYPVQQQVNSRLECPATTTTYELRVNWPNGSVEIRPQPIQVSPAPAAPVITSFVLNPPAQIQLGQCVAISWSVTGNINSVQLLSNGLLLWDNAPSSGNFQDCPNRLGQVSYTLIAKNAGGESKAQAYLNVGSANTAVPTSSPTVTGQPTVPATAVPSVTPAPPVIESFSAKPDELAEGECTQVSWHVSGNATLIQIFRNNVVVADNVGFTGTAPDCLTEAGVVPYRIEASNPNGKAVDEIFVTVNPAIGEGLPLQNTKWTLDYYYDGVGALIAVLPNTEITAQFTTEGIENKVNGSAGCNNYSADYQFSETALTVGALSITNQLCNQPNGIMTQEQAYTTMLRNVATYRIVGDLLELKNASGQIILQYKGEE